MGSHPFRELPPESTGGAHCVRCGHQNHAFAPHIELVIDRDGSVICDACRPEPPPGTHASDLAESMTKRLVGVLVALTLLMWIVSRCAR